MATESRSALSRGDAPEYMHAILKFLGERDPFDVIEETEEKLRVLTQGLSDEHLRTPEKTGKWSILEVMWHLADVEIVLGFRYRMVAAQPGSAVSAIDQDTWAKQLDYNGRGLSDALEDFARVRAVNLRFLKGLPKERFEQFAMHEERGKETLQDMVRFYAAHDSYHLYQIDRIKTAIGA